MAPELLSLATRPGGTGGEVLEAHFRTSGTTFLTNQWPSLEEAHQALTRGAPQRKTNQRMRLNTREELDAFPTPAPASATDHITEHATPSNPGQSGSELDLSKCFDGVPHEKVLQKLAHYGITTHWFSNYLADHSQQVQVATLPATSDRLRQLQTAQLEDPQLDTVIRYQCFPR